MKQYSRAKEKTLTLTSVKCHTIDKDDDQRVQNARKGQRRSILHDPKDHGEGEYQSSGSCKTDRSPALQRQQDHAGENAGEPRILIESCRELGARGGNKTATKEVKDAA